MKRLLVGVVTALLVALPVAADLTPGQVDDLNEIIAASQRIQAEGETLLTEPELEPELAPTIEEIIDDAEAIEMLANEILAIG